MIVASIDTKTGRTALISLPRNLLDGPAARGQPAARRSTRAATSASRRLLQQPRSTTGQCMLNTI